LFKSGLDDQAAALALGTMPRIARVSRAQALTCLGAHVQLPRTHLAAAMFSLAFYGDKARGARLPQPCLARLAWLAHKRGAAPHPSRQLPSRPHLALLSLALNLKLNEFSPKPRRALHASPHPMRAGGSSPPLCELGGWEILDGRVELYLHVRLAALETQAHLRVE